MKAIIVHLSDIHLKCKDNIVLSRMSKIIDSIQNISASSDALFLVITGDIAFSGLIPEYYEAMTLVDYVKTSLESYSKNKVHIIMIPGNHDCDYTITSSKIRESVIKTIKDDQHQQEKIDVTLIDHCCLVQKNFNEFQKAYLDQEAVVQSDKLLSILDYKESDYTITINCLNTSWLSQLDEQYGRLNFPIKNYPKEIFKRESDLIISLLHHPFNWQDPNQYRELRDFLECVSDIILTGHEHTSSKSVIDHLDGNYIEYIEGYVLQNSDDDDISGFNTIELNLEEQTHRIHFFKWTGDFYSSKNAVTDWIPFRKSRYFGKDFDVNTDFKTFLIDPGALFRHPYKAELTLDDIFVFPDLREFKIQKKGQDGVIRETVRSSLLSNVSPDGNRTLLIGKEKSGKTSLCCKLFRKYLAKGYVPVLINGGDVKSSNTADFEKTLLRVFAQQYSKNAIEKFSQLVNAKKIIIIDDLHQCSLNYRHRSILISRIGEQYQNILLTANEIFQIEEIIYDEEDEERLFKDFQKFEIMEFGHVLRSEIIEKWNLAGRENIIEDTELFKINDRSKRILDTIIGKNFVPSRPFFLLTILQSIEFNNAHSLKESSYGYYYEYLITQSMIKINLKNEEIDSYYTYLMELANIFFMENAYWVTPERLAVFNQWFTTEYAVSVDLHNFKENLVIISILHESDGAIKFKYNYVYYFFVARYLANSITKENIKHAISEMAKRLYIDENANIVMFLTHLSKDPFVLDNVLENAKNLFSDHLPIQLDGDIEIINSLSDEIPKVILENKDVRKTRTQKLELEDKIENIEQNQRDQEQNYLPELEIDKLNFLEKLNLSFKTIEVMGQILKNYYGSLRAKIKFDLCEASYATGLRALKSFFSLIEEHQNFLVNLIIDDMNKKQLNDELEVQKISRRVLFIFVCMMAYSFVKRISMSIGSENLSTTFKQILEKNNSISNRLIDISIKLDFFSIFPFDDIKKLVKNIPKNGLQYAILQQFVLDYLYMFPTNYREKQQICQLVGISMETQRLIDQKSAERKR